MCIPPTLFNYSELLYNKLVTVFDFVYHVFHACEGQSDLTWIFSTNNFVAVCVRKKLTMINSMTMIFNYLVRKIKWI